MQKTKTTESSPPRHLEAVAEQPTAQRQQNEREAQAGATHDDIAARAHAIYVSEGGVSGNDVGHWHQAERELSEEGSRGR